MSRTSLRNSVDLPAPSGRCVPRPSRGDGWSALADIEVFVFTVEAELEAMDQSYAFVAEPETNGCIERFFRTLKEQAIHGRIFQTLDDVRATVRTSVTRYNTKWLIEKNGH